MSLGVNDVAELVLRCFEGAGGLTAIEVAWRLGEVARVDKGRGTRCFAEVALALQDLEEEGKVRYTDGFYFKAQEVEE